VFPLWSSVCVQTLCSKIKKTAFGEYFSRGMMLKKCPQREEEENKEDAVDMEDVDEEGGDTDDD
jgi:hypothetical protein